MRLLVTGGAGYIGAVVVAQLVAAGHDVEVLDDLSTGHASRAAGRRRRAHPGHLRGRGGAHPGRRVRGRAALRRQDRGGRVRRPAGDLLADQRGWDARAPGRGTPCRGAPARVQLDGRGLRQPDPGAGHRDLPARPDQPVRLDQARRRHGRRAHGRGTRARRGQPALLQRRRRARSARAACRWASGTTRRPTSSRWRCRSPPASARQLQIFGGDYPTRDGTCVRDYIHVEDLAAAHLLALDAIEPARHRIYNLGNGTGFTNLQIVDVVRSITGAPVPVVPAPRRPGDPAALVASSARARDELGLGAVQARPALDRPRRLDVLPRRLGGEMSTHRTAGSTASPGNGWSSRRTGPRGRGRARSRTRRPTDRPRYDPECYLCPGNARAGGHRTPEYTSTYVFDNDFAALLPDVQPWRTDRDGLLVAEAERGLCRVVCFSPRHDLTLGGMTAPALAHGGRHLGRPVQRAGRRRTGSATCRSSRTAAR